MKKILAIVVLVLLLLTLLVGCTEADKVNANISNQAFRKNRFPLPRGSGGKIEGGAEG